MPGPKEAAASVFERIRRRRNAPPEAGLLTPAPAAAPAAAPAPFTQPGPASPATSPDDSPDTLQIDELLFDPHGHGTSHGSGSARSPKSSRAFSDGSGVAGTFPRSATMRLLLKHPAMALGVGMPAAALLLSSPGARRVLAAVALQAGSNPELRRLLQASAAALQLPPAAESGAQTKKSPVRGQNQGGNFK